jgi:hypothetical protein
MKTLEELERENEALRKKVVELTQLLDQVHRKFNLRPILDDQVMHINARVGKPNAA